MFRSCTILTSLGLIVNSQTQVATSCRRRLPGVSTDGGNFQPGQWRGTPVAEASLGEHIAKDCSASKMYVANRCG